MFSHAQQPDIILASASPRRRQLLSALGVTFGVAPADVDESPLPGEHPHALARRLGQAKARVAAGQRRNALVIAADTLVVLGGEILGKPASRAEALAMLSRLRGRRHLVDTGLALHHAASGLSGVWVAETPVVMRTYGDDEMLRYVATGDPLDKAGAYAVQHDGFAPVARLEDCYANVVGLPLCHLYRALAVWGAPPPHHPLRVCPWAVERGGCEWANAILAGGWRAAGIEHEAHEDD
jgi:septum formation protein